MIDDSETTVTPDVQAKAKLTFEHLYSDAYILAEPRYKNGIPQMEEWRDPIIAIIAIALQEAFNAGVEAGAELVESNTPTEQTSHVGLFLHRNAIGVSESQKCYAEGIRALKLPDGGK